MLALRGSERLVPGGPVGTGAGCIGGSWMFDAWPSCPGKEEGFIGIGGGAVEETDVIDGYC